MRSALLAALLGASSLGAGAEARAQSGPTGSLDAFPFDAPFPLVEESEDEASFIRVYDAPYAECVAFFQTSFADRTELAPGWALVGQGLDSTTDEWRFGLLWGGRVLYDLEVRRSVHGCAVAVGTDADPIPGGRWRWSFPPLELSDGSELAVDPLVVDE